MLEPHKSPMPSDVKRFSGSEAPTEDRERTSSQRSRRRRRVLAVAVVALAALLPPLLGSEVASAVVPPRNPDRASLPIISGTKVSVPGGSCTAGAVLTPKSLFSRLTAYQRATRWVVLAKHCAPMYASIHMGTRAVGNVVWQSATSDIELVRVSPQPDNMALICAAHHSQPAFCSPFQTYTPLANNRVFFLANGREARVPVSGWADAPDDQFCTSGWASGVKCVWHGFSLEPGIYRPPYEHISAANASEFESIANGDSGGPVVTYDRHLLGIISSGEAVGRTGGRSVVYYTPMRQVLHELFSYELGPADIPTAEGEGNALPDSGSGSGSNAGWELAPN